MEYILECDVCLVMFWRLMFVIIFNENCSEHLFVCCIQEMRLKSHSLGGFFVYYSSHLKLGNCN